MQWQNLLKNTQSFIKDSHYMHCGELQAKAVMGNKYTNAQDYVPVKHNTKIGSGPHLVPYPQNKWKLPIPIFTILLPSENPSCVPQFPHAEASVL